jgi:hypothetical protein
MAFSNYFIPTDSRSSRAATMAASLQTFDISAPLKPGVKDAIFLAYSSLVFSAFNLIFFK